MSGPVKSSPQLLRLMLMACLAAIFLFLAVAQANSSGPAPTKTLSLGAPDSWAELSAEPINLLVMTDGRIRAIRPKPRSFLPLPKPEGNWAGFNTLVVLLQGSPRDSQAASRP